MAYRETAQVRARKDGVRVAILEAARALVGQGGFRAAQMTAVAAGAGVATGTIYRYFPTQIELFAEVFRDNSQREVEAMLAATVGDGNCTQRLNRALAMFISRALRNRRLAYALIAEPVDPQVEAERLRYRQAYAMVLEKLVQEGIVSGEFAPQDAHVTATALVGVLGEALLGPLLHSVPTARESVADSIIALCLRAVGAKA
ncbi:TetR/AcrR family transcriptional regulator [Nevskia soli]|uniref:TetR/AcrR family transcriptional regulator n=1 Tax=Nevskia soli TaxID=418856 RepID=UPI0004A785D4|nr:TetR/AcrR family transcriptional regulator [Nevskia soli]